MEKTNTLAMQVQPYLFFEGRCEEALEFYRTALGAEIMQVMRFKESPEPGHCGTVDGDKVMHADFRIGETTLMASDGMCANPASFKGFSLTITAPSEADADRIFNALAEGGEVQMPLGKTFFAAKFGMVADRFGLSWMVIVLP